jgi:hypothetical protein
MAETTLDPKRIEDLIAERCKAARVVFKDVVSKMDPPDEG